MESQFGAIYEKYKFFMRSIISLMLWLLIMVAAFNLIVSLIMIVKGKASDIAILRALGASPLMIRSIFIWQGGLIGLIGIIFGVILGIVGSFQIGNLAAYAEDLFSINLLNADVYPIDFLPSEFSIFDVGSVCSLVSFYSRYLQLSIHHQRQLLLLRQNLCDPPRMVLSEEVNDRNCYS